VPEAGTPIGPPLETGVAAELGVEVGVDGDETVARGDDVDVSAEVGTTLEVAVGVVGADGFAAVAIGAGVLVPDVVGVLVRVGNGLVTQAARTRLATTATSILTDPCPIRTYRTSAGIVRVSSSLDE